MLRLSRDGLTTISEKGMSDFFGDNLAVSSTIIGTYNEDKGSYNITLNNKTLSFDERVDGWTSFKSFIPESGLSINNKYYTFKDGDLYSHDNTTRNTFYNVNYESSVNVLFNDISSSVKSFKTLNYEGSDSRKYTYSGSIGATTIGSGTTIEVLEKSGYTPTQISGLTETASKGWYANSISTDQQTGSVKFFKSKENFKFNKILGDTTTSSNIDTKELSVQGLGVPSSISTSGVVNKILTVTPSISLSNFTISSSVIFSASGTNTIGSGKTAVFTITPSDGYVISASQVSSNSDLSNIASVSNADTGTAGTIGNTVEVTFVMVDEDIDNTATITPTITVSTLSLAQYTVTGVYNTDEVNTSTSSLYNFGYSGSGDYFLHSTVNGLVSNSTKVTLSSANSLLSVGMTVVGSGVTKGTTISAINSSTITLSNKATIPDDTLLKFGKEIISKTFTADNGFAFPLNPTLDVIKEDENSISEYSTSSDHTIVTANKVGSSTTASNTFVLDSVTGISATMLVTGEGIVTTTKVVSINSITKTIAVDKDVLINSGEKLSFTPTVVVFKVHYVFSTNNPTEDRLLLTARAGKAFLNKPDQITELQVSTQNIPINGDTREIHVVGRQGAKFILKEFTEGTVNGAVSNSSSVSLDSANYAILAGMTVTNGGSGIGKVKSYVGNAITIDRNVTIPDNAVLRFRVEHNGESFTQDITNIEKPTTLIIPSNGVRTFSRKYDKSENSKIFNYEVVPVSPTTLALPIKGSNPATVSQFADVTFKVKATENFTSSEANLGNTNELSITKNAGKNDQSEDLDFSFAITADSGKKLREIKQPSPEDFKYATIIKTVKSISDAVNVGSGCTAVIEFVGTTTQSALVTGSSTTGMVVKTHEKKNSSNPSLPDGVYLKSLEPVALSNLNKLTIAHDSKDLNVLSQSIQQGDKISFSAPYTYNLAFIKLNGLMTDSSNNEVISTVAVAKYETTGTSIILEKANNTITTGMVVSSSSVPEDVTVTAINTVASTGVMTLTISGNKNIKAGEELTFFEDDGDTYTVSGTAQVNKFGTENLTSEFLFDNFVKVLVSSGGSDNNDEASTYALTSIKTNISSDSLASGGVNLKTKHPIAKISLPGFGDTPIYVGKGTDSSGNGVPDTNSSSNVLTENNTTIDFTLNFNFPKDDSYSGFYKIKIEAKPNNVFDSFSVGNESNTARVYENSDIKEHLYTQGVATQNVFQWDFSCQTSRDLTINDIRLALNFKVTISQVGGRVHPTFGYGAENNFEDNTNNTDGGIGVRAGGGVGVDFPDPSFKDQDPYL